jgi:hypothetical protein
MFLLTLTHLVHDRVGAAALGQIIIIALTRSPLSTAQATIADPIDDGRLPLDHDSAIGTH